MAVPQLQGKSYKDFTGGINEMHIDAPDNTYLSAINLWLDNNYKLTSRAGIVPYNNTYPIADTGHAVTSPILRLFSWTDLVLSGVRSDYLFAFRQDGTVLYLKEAATGTDWTNAAGIATSLWYTTGGASGGILQYYPLSSTILIDNTLLATCYPYEPIKIQFGYTADSTTERMLVRTAGMPQLRQTPVPKITTVGAESYLYSFTLSSSYVNINNTVLDESARFIMADPVIGTGFVYQILANSYSDVFIHFPVGSGISITSPHLYDLTNTYLNVYRTTNGGTVFYKINFDSTVNSSSRIGSMLDGNGQADGWCPVENSAIFAIGNEVTILDLAAHSNTRYIIDIAPGIVRLSASVGGVPIDSSLYTTANNSFIIKTSVQNTPVTNAMLQAGVVIRPYVQDTSLVLSTQLYTNGGVLDNDPPPPAHYVVAAGNIVWYLNVSVYTQPEGKTLGWYGYANRMVQSVPNDFDSVPSGNYLDLPETITGGAYTESQLLIIFTRNKVYRVSESYDELGGGNPYFVEISNVTGCVSHSSIVVDGDKIYFAGKDSFYVTNGYTVTRLSDKFQTAYSKWAPDSKFAIPKARYIQAAHSNEEDKIHWIINPSFFNQGATEETFIPYAVATLDTRLINADNSCFTASHNQRWHYDNGLPTLYAESISAVTYHRGDIVFGTYGNLVMKLSESAYYDLKANLSYLTDVTKWTAYNINYFFNSSCTNFGIDEVRKWVPSMIVNCQNITNLSLSVQTEADNGGVVKTLKNIIYRNSSPNPYAEPVKSYRELAIYQRKIPAPGLRVNYIEVKFLPALIISQNSDEQSKATVNATLKLAVLDTGKTFEQYAVGQSIYFEDSNYLVGYVISAVNVAGDTLTYVDAGNTSTNGYKKWVIKGNPAGEKFRLLSYTLNFMPMSKSQNSYHGETGANV